VKQHEREGPVVRAKLDLSVAVSDAREKVDLTDVEYLQWLTDEMDRTLKWMLRMERHGDYDTPAGLAKEQR
jgi:hypothetical protein